MVRFVSIWSIWFGHLFFLWCPFSQAQSQHHTEVQGFVLEESEKGRFVPLEAVSVFWLGLNLGTTTDSVGHFSIHKPQVDSTTRLVLVIRQLGYEADTLFEFPPGRLRIILASGKSKKLKEVVVEGRLNSTFQLSEAFNISQMNRKELVKAACCNLSESFETNPAVDVSYSDALTGAKQIQMLGLSGNYVLLTQENLPGIRGLLSGYGFGFTPGPWIESIQVTKGQGSVVNGYESLTGQINVELKKTDWLPRTREKLFVNAYANQMGRLEANVNQTVKVAPGLLVTNLFHGNVLKNKVDINNDHFLDIPTGNQLQAMQRWSYENKQGIRAQAGVQFMDDSRTGGTVNSDPNPNKNYTIGLENRQFQAFSKLGYLFPKAKYKSMGWMNSYTQNRVRNRYGSTAYSGDQKTWYSNFIYQSIIGSTNLTFKAGGGIRWDSYKETVSFDADSTHGNWNRTEVVPGVFTEFSWTPVPWFTQVAGLRYDYHNMFGHWLTPRLHSKISFSEQSVLRLSAGLGRRVANVFAENPALFASSRNWYLPAANGSTGLYEANSSGLVSSQGGLKPEEALNVGLGFSQGFYFKGKKGNLTADLYRTDFIQQTVVDLDRDSRAVFLYNLKGKSYATAFQVQVEYEPIRRLDVRLAWKWQDVRQTLHGNLMEKPLVASQRLFLNLAYETRNKWTVDATVNWVGSKRLPTTSQNPEGLQFLSRSPNYFAVNGQITKAWKGLELYAGVENLLNYRQTQLILNADNPNQTYFDASLIWGPVIGRMTYAGLRWTVR